MIAELQRSLTGMVRARGGKTYLFGYWFFGLTTQKRPKRHDSSTEHDAPPLQAAAKVPVLNCTWNFNVPKIIAFRLSFWDKAKHVGTL